MPVKIDEKQQKATSQFIWEVADILLSGIAGTLNPVEPIRFAAHRIHLPSGGRQTINIETDCFV